MRKIKLYALLATTLASSSVYAGLTDVIDSKNLVQNTMIAERALQSNLHELEMLVNQLEMLKNQAKHLASMPASVYSRIAWNISRLEGLVNDTLAMTMDYRSVLGEYNTRFPGWHTYVEEDSTDYYARTYWWQKQTQDAIQDALRSQGLVADVSQDRINLESMITASDSSVGSLSALQAGNSIAGLMVEQLMSLRQIIASSERQQSLYLAEQMGQKEISAVRAARQAADWTEAGERDVMSESEYMNFFK